MPHSVIIRNINLALLKELKAQLVQLLWDKPGDPLWSIVRLLDDIQDQLEGVKSA